MKAQRHDVSHVTVQKILHRAMAGERRSLAFSPGKK
jgi:hypothetical protein